MKRLLRAWIGISVFTFAAIVEGASPEYQAVVSNDAPVLYYQFNELTGVAVNYGSLGTAYDATYLGTPLRGLVTASGDAGVCFDSAEDYLESTSVAPASLSGNPTFSAEAVFFVPTTGSATLWAPFLHWGVSMGLDPTMRSVYFSFSRHDADEAFAGFYNGGLQTVDPVALGQWHHVVWVRQGGGAANVGSTLYIDGVSVSLENDPDLPADGGTPNVINTAFRVNRAQDFTRFFTGTLDEVALYDRMLTAEEVQEHFDALGGVCTLPPGDLVAWWTGDDNAYDLQNVHDGTLQGGTTFAAGMVGSAFSFDGVDDYVTVPHHADFNPSGAFSVDAWFNADPQQPGPNGQFLIVDKSHGFTDGTGWALQGNPNGTLAFFFGTGGGSGDPANFTGVSSTVSVLDDQWHHVAGVFTGAQFEIYLDGALGGSQSFTGLPVGNNRAVVIGRSWGGGTPTRHFHGLIDEVEFFDRALSGTEVQAISEAGTAGKCKPKGCGPGRCRETDGTCKACAQPISTGAAPTASDALAILRTAVGSQSCRLCVCDVDTSGAVVATDALLTLKRAVGQALVLECPPG